MNMYGFQVHFGNFGIEPFSLELADENEQKCTNNIQ
jgi:hypothetical protein